MFVEAFGHITPNMEVLPPDSGEAREARIAADGYLYEDLYSIFMTRSKLMGWHWNTTGDDEESLRRLWGTEEAELTFHEADSRIGFVQAGFGNGPVTLEPSEPTGATPQHRMLTKAEVDALDPAIRASGTWAPYPMPDEPPPTEPTVGIPPLLQCVDDAIRWFGDTKVSAYQLTGFDLLPGELDSMHRLMPCLNWFNSDPSKPRTRSMVSVAADRWDARITAAAPLKSARWRSARSSSGR